jgi:hypothetical protein
VKTLYDMVGLQLDLSFLAPLLGEGNTQVRCVCAFLGSGHLSV